MKVACVDCDTVYDDARCSTICPHEPFLTIEQAARKDLAIQMIGKPVRFITDHPDASNRAPHLIRAVLWNGMVELADMAGSYSPYVLEVIE